MLLYTRASSPPTQTPDGRRVPRRARTLVALTAGLAVLLSACAASSSPSAEKKLTIGFAEVGLTGSFLVAESYGVSDEAKKQGVDLVFLEAGGFGGIQKQIANVETLIERKVDAIIIDPISVEALTPVLDEAKAAGIPVVGVGDLVDHPAVVASATSKQEDIGKAMGQALVDANQGKQVNLIVLAGPPSAEWSTKRLAGFESVIKTASNIKVLTTQSFPDETRANGLKLAEDFLKTFPTANAFYTADNAVGLGVGDTIKQQGKVGQVQIVTCVVDSDTVQMIKDGVITADVAQQPVTGGRLALNLAIKAARGEKVDLVTYVPTVTITPSAVGQVDTSTMMAPEGWKP
jgi:ABC-type sugar transport system substrate-binding protein